jgi:hypothetical protein
VPRVVSMRQLRRFVALPAADRSELTRAFIAVAAIRLALSVLPFRVVRPVIARITARPRGPGAGADDAQRVAWAVAAAAVRIPRATCLTQALAAQVLLARIGEHAELRLGVARAHGAPALAHAWLEHRGQVLVGGGWLEQYMPLPFIDGHAAPTYQTSERLQLREE